jgi:hypothetical protein
MRITRNFDGTEVTFVYTGRLESGRLSGKAVVEGLEAEVAGDWTAKKIEPPPAGSTLVGEWDMELKLNEETRDYTLRFESRDGKIEGFLISPRSGEHPAESTSIEDQEFKMRVKREYNGNPLILIYTGRLDAGSLAGKVVIEGFEGQGSGEWKAKKK